MNIYTLLASGRYHPVYCEDHQYYHSLDKKWFVGAVMDGCSSAKESHFASALFGKSLRKSCSMLPRMKHITTDFDLKLMDSEAIGEFILGQLFEDVKKIRKGLFLEIEELLSTILLLVFDRQDKAAWVNISGDGIVTCNGATEEIDQNNIPDYLGYHLDIKFDDWYRNHTRTMEFEDVSDISISTDGLGKIGPNLIRNPKPLDPIQHFLVNKPKTSSENALQEEFRQLQESKDFIFYDDISVIRLIV